MKHGMKWLVAALLTLAMQLSVWGAAAENAYGVATLDRVAVRKQPTTSANYWFRIDTGFVCQILDMVEGDGEYWYKVNSTHPDPGKNNTYIGYVRAEAFRPMTSEETAQYLANGSVSVQTGTSATTGSSASSGSTADGFGGSFDTGIMGGNTATPSPTPAWNPSDEEDDYASDSGATGGFGSVGFDTLVTGVGQVTASGTNFRLAPSTDAGLIGKLNAGDVVELVTIPAQIGSDSWYRVRYNGQEGYIQSTFIRVLSVGTTPTPAPSVYGYAKLIYDSANLRDAPSGTTRAQWVGKGSLLQIVGVPQSKGGYLWYPVYYGVDGKTYYVREDVITLVGYTGGSAATATPAPDYSGAYGYVKTVESGVNLRLKPGGETIAQLPRGQVVPCVGAPVNPEDSAYTWYYVQYAGMTGYLRGDCVQVCTADGGSVAVTPTPTPTPTPAVGSAYGYIRLVKSGVNLRDKPGGTSQTQLPRDLILPVTGDKVASGRYDWYPVRTPDGRLGYIRSDCLVLCDAQGNEVTATPTPTPGGSTGGTPTLSTYGYVKITATGTNLRDNVAGETLTQLRKDTVWPMCGIAVTYGSYTWYPIQADGYTGWVRGDCAFKLSATQEMAYLTNGTVPEGTPAPTPAMSKFVITVLDYVNLRASASRDAAAPFKVRTGTVMAFTGTKTVGTSLWYRVVYQGTEVWVLGTCVEVMTSAEYDAWLSQNPGAAPDTDASIGYIVTIKGGVNIRSTAGGSTILTQVSRGTVMPYYAGPTAVGSYSWYAVRTESGVEGYIRSDMVRVCDENGDAIVTVTPTPAPGGSTGSNPGSPQEATYTTLRLGSSGTAVYNLVQELKNQGFYTGAVTSSYTTAVQQAVIAFQSAKGLTIDGIAGSQTQHALYGTVPPGTANTSDLTFTFYPVEKIDWFTGGIQQLWAKGANYKVYDVRTGIVWWAHRWSGGFHADIEPLTAADTARLCQIYGVDDAQDIWDDNLWQRRPCLVTIGTRTFACSLMGMPHNPDGDTIPNNNMTGQICMHFTNSKGHESGKVDTYHTKAIQEAYDWAKARYGAR
ncbi:MAG: SH3 domain-containing protein [Clostridia bacterium]|nr:SH3 domain-containing protein [Clostridia bacterium]